MVPYRRGLTSWQFHSSLALRVVMRAPEKAHNFNRSRLLAPYWPSLARIGKHFQPTPHGSGLFGLGPIYSNETTARPPEPR